MLVEEHGRVVFYVLAWLMARGYYQRSAAFTLWAGRRLHINVLPWDFISATLPKSLEQCLFLVRWAMKYFCRGSPWPKKHELLDHGTNVRKGLNRAQKCASKGIVLKVLCLWWKNEYKHVTVPFFEFSPEHARLVFGLFSCEIKKNHQTGAINTEV